MGTDDKKAINLRVRKETCDKIDKVRENLSGRAQGARVSQADAVRAMIDAGAECILRGDASPGVRRDA